MSDIHDFFATVPKGMEDLLAAELRAFGVAGVRPGQSGVGFRGPLEDAYRVCLWSRTASRVLLPLLRFPAATPEALYEGIRNFPWEEHLDPEGSLAVDFNHSRSVISHSHFGALKVKDGIVDRFRDLCGVRPSVDRGRPDLRINVYLLRDTARVSLDLSGESLHRRGYRQEGAAAPLKENLAAAILMRSGWPQIAQAGGPLVDPMCGSATLLVEGAMIAGDVAPGLLRPHFGFLHWKGHDAAAWERLLAEAQERRSKGVDHIPPIVGFDLQALAIRSALANIEAAGLRGRVHVERRDLPSAEPPKGEAPGLLVANPPYGERLGEEAELVGLYGALGNLVRRKFAGWRAAVFTGNPHLALRLGLPVARRDTLFNGPIECRLLHLESAGQTGSPGTEMVANRLRKNLRTLGKWARREGVDCYRLYDADLPEYAVAVDLYQGEEGRWAHVQEYQAPSTVDPEKAESRLAEALAAVSDVLDLDPGQVYLKVRRRQKGAKQYGKIEQSQDFHVVKEDGCRFLVNFRDYLDTGLFLDHRITRRLIGEMARGRRFLNLFAYTGAATVHAAAGGAKETVTVDLSRTYLDWAKRNLMLNDFGGPEHRLVQADCLQWLEKESGRKETQRFDLIFLDPPTFSNSKRMAGTFDVQRDHAEIIRQAVQLLAPGGILIFSTNARKFRLEEKALQGLEIADLTRATIPQDFARNPRIHQCWRIGEPEGGSVKKG